MDRPRDATLQGLKLFVGKCIYCGSREPPLTREHVIARGLGGDWSTNHFRDALVLQRASCAACQRVTQAIEHECLRAMLEYARLRLGFKRKDRVNETVEAIVEYEDGREELRRVPIDAVPGALAVPSFYEARAFAEPVLTEAPGPSDLKMVVAIRGDMRLVPGARKIGVRLRADSIRFAQMLAKIALGVAVAQLGVDGFTPLVRKRPVNTC